MLADAALFFVLPLLQQGAPQTEASSLRPAFLKVLSEEEPKRRKKALRALLRTEKKKLGEWASFLKELPHPPLPLKNPVSGRVDHREVHLWTGKTGILETSIAIYLPSGYQPQLRYPLLVACHGAGGNANWEMAQWRPIAEQVPMIVVVANEQKENRGYRYSEQERLTQLSLLRWVKLHLSVDNNAVFLAGTSRGGHIVWDLGTRRPHQWAGLVACIGGPRFTTQKGNNNMRLLLNLVDIPMRDLQGEKDDPNLLWNLRLAFELLEKLKATDAKLLTFPELAHSYRLEEVDWQDFFRTRRRDPVPSRLRLAAVRLNDARRLWLQMLRFGREVKSAFTPRVEQRLWTSLDMNGKKRFIVEAADKRTARFEARFDVSEEARNLVIETERVRRLRLLLPHRLVAADGKTIVQLVWNGKKRKLYPKPDIQLFLLDFSEHLDLETAPVRVVDFKL